MAPRALLFACSVGVLALVSPALRAQQPQDDAALAQSLFDAGLASKERGDMRAACNLFEQSVDVAATPHGWLQVGTCREQVDPARALDGFEAALAAAAGVPDATRRKAYENAARERIAQLERRVPTVVFRPSPTPGVAVDVTAAGRRVAVDRYEEPLRFNPGQYRVRAWAAGSYSYLLDLELMEGERRVIALPRLEPLPKGPITPAPLRTERRPVVTSGAPAASSTATSAAAVAAAPYAPEHVAPPEADESSGLRFSALPVTLFGSGAALVVAGIVSGQISSAARDDLVQECRAVGPDQRECPSSSADTKDRMQDYALAADVLWISGALLAGTGITLFILDQGARETTHVAAGCFAGGCGLSAAGRF
jgi:hypothetical protein